MNENFKVFFKVSGDKGKTIATGCFDKEYKSKSGAKRFIAQMSERFPGVDMESAVSNPFIE